MDATEFFTEQGTFKPGALAAARKAAGLTQARLGQIIGRSYLTVSRWERGSTTIPGTLYPLLPEALGLTWPPAADGQGR